MNLIAQVLLLALVVALWPDIGLQAAGCAGSALMTELVGELRNAPPLRLSEVQPKNTLFSLGPSSGSTPWGVRQRLIPLAISHDRADTL